MFGILKSLFSKDAAKLPELLKQNPFLVDVRSAAEFQSGHVPGAVNIPLNQLSGELQRFKNKQNIIVFCQSGMRSSQAKSMLEKNGITGVTNAGSWQTVDHLLKNN